ncbi:MAG: hypothetical protein ACRDF6_06470, partial [bacterium]
LLSSGRERAPQPVMRDEGPPQPRESVPKQPAVSDSGLATDEWRPRKWAPGMTEKAKGKSNKSALPLRRLQADDHADEEVDPGRDRAVRWLATAAVLAAIVIGTVLLFRFEPWKQSEPAAVQPTRASQEPVADPVIPPPADTALSKRNAGDATPPISSARVATTPAKPKPARPAAASPNRYGIAVGTYLNSERAEFESQRLSAATRLRGRVNQIDEDSLPAYQIILGSFTGFDAAEEVASALIARGVVVEARVVTQRAARTPR